MRAGAFQAWVTGLALAIIALVAGPAFAQAGSVGVPIRTCVLPISGPVDARALFARPELFYCAGSQKRWGPGDYAVLSEPLPPGSGLAGPMLVRSASVWQARATLHALYADGFIHRDSFNAHRATRRIDLGAIFSHPLPRRDVSVVQLLWVVEGSSNIRGIVPDARLAAVEQVTRSNLVLAAVYAGFAGLCLTFLIYNLALWCALRHPFQLAYCAMVAVLLTYAFTSSGVMAWVFPEIGNNDRMRLNYISLAGAAASALFFARSFFEPRVFTGWAGRASTAASVALLLAALAFAMFTPWRAGTLDRIYACGFVGVLLAAAAILWRAWRVRSNYLGLFAIAWAAPIAFACLRVSSNFQIVPITFWLDNSTLLAMAAEAVLSSLAIAYRINLLSRERDAARAGETIYRALADIDPLTGLLNRRAFLHAAIGREGEQLLLLADIDNFKRINDTVGHDAGDEVLRAVARAMEGAVPNGALVARVGGEEFAIVTSAASPADPAAVLAALRAQPMPFDLDVTASIGVSQGSLTRETDWKALYREADLALLDAKASGRDRVRRALAPASA